MKQLLHFFDFKSIPFFVLCTFVVISIQSNATVFINEVVSSNSTYEVEGEYPDWIELYNDADTEVNLNGFGISDKKKKPFKYVLPDVVIPSKGYLLLYADGLEQGLHLSFKISADGEDLYLTSPDEENTEHVEVPALASDNSYGRKTDGNSEFLKFGKPSPLSANNPKDVLLETPVISLPSGFYDSPITVEIALEQADAEIRYTLDGSTPNDTSLLYSEPLTLTKTTVLRAVSSIPGVKYSSPVSATFMLDERKPGMLAVFLVTDSVNLFSDTTGIYVEGTNGISGNCSNTPKNWNQDWERPAWITLIDTNGDNYLNQTVGISIHGGCTRTFEKKTLAVIARKEYGSNNLKYSFFKTKPNLDSFKSILLRNSGNDYPFTKLRDCLSSSVFSDFDIDLQAFEPSVVYINGKYWGIHNIREKINEHFIENNHNDVSKDDVNIVEKHTTASHGTMDNYETEIRAFLDQNPVLDDYLYAVLTSRIDLRNYIDYMIAETFISNTDWPHNNIRCWNAPSHKKWRWILYDTDSSYNYRSITNAQSPAIFDDYIFNEDYKWATKIFRGCVTNEKFLDEFTQKYAYNLSTRLSADVTIAKLDSIADLLKDEMFYEMKRWPHGWNNYEHWYGEIDTVKTFLQERPKAMRNILSERFGVEGEYNTVISVNNGEADINFYDYKMELPFEGVLFGKRPIQLVPEYDKTLYEFGYWEIVADNGSKEIVESDILNYVLKDNSTIKLVLKNITTNIDDVDYSPRLAAHPNPASDFVTITGADDNSVYIIYDLNGNQLITSVDNHIDISNIKAGTYLLAATSDNSTLWQKLIISSSEN